jgi:hypothetical protein
LVFGWIGNKIINKIMDGFLIGLGVGIFLAVISAEFI